MAVFPWQAIVVDENGNAISGASVTVKENTSGGAVATIYSDANETALANPFTSASDGFAQFWAKPGTYYIEATSGGETSDGWTVTIAPVEMLRRVTLTASVAEGEAVTASGALCSEATAAQYLGLAKESGTSGDSIEFQRVGEITLGSWAWTAGQYVYVTNAGALTQTPPTGSHRRIGIATAATKIALFPGYLVVEVGGTGNDLPALDDSGVIDLSMIPKAATAGTADTIVQTDGSGEIDASFLTALADTSCNFTASGAITAGDAVALTGNKTVAAVLAGNVANVIGFADATVADTGTVAVSVFTNINTQQSGLTENTDYYILDNGSLSTSDTDGNGLIGRALSATKILVTKNSW